jgi:hypothetical protein
MLLKAKYLSSWQRSKEENIALLFLGEYLMTG